MVVSVKFSNTDRAGYSTNITSTTNCCEFVGKALFHEEQEIRWKVVDDKIIETWHVSFYN